VHDWEVEVVFDFFELLYSQRVRRGGVDKMYWIPSKRKSFQVKSYYYALSPLVSSHFPWKSIWKVNAPSRVVVFVWTTALGKILTLDNLQKMNATVVDWCCMSKKSGESIDHLLFY
jgi:hypothetical protein